jgi:cytidylate kinase
VSRPDKIVIAIDGFSSCGKSTLARELAKQLHYVFIDSGAMYRGITLFALRTNCINGSELDRGKLIQLLDEINLSFRLNPETHCPELHLNGENVEGEIRTPEVAAQVSQVATIREVREKMVAQQRDMGKNGGVVMDGRDIGSVVFPYAELKLFVTAEINIRVQRRYSELKDKGINISEEEVRANLLERDRIDSTRAESPLTQTKDAIVIDNTKLSRSQQLELSLELVQKKIVTLA